MSNWKVGPGGRLYHPTTGAYVGQLDDNGNEQMVVSAFPSGSVVVNVDEISVGGATAGVAGSQIPEQPEKIVTRVSASAMSIVTRPANGSPLLWGLTYNPGGTPTDSVGGNSQFWRLTRLIELVSAALYSTVAHTAQSGTWTTGISVEMRPGAGNGGQTLSLDRTQTTGGTGYREYAVTVPASGRVGFVFAVSSSAPEAITLTCGSATVTFDPRRTLAYANKAELVVAWLAGCTPGAGTLRVTHAGTSGKNMYVLGPLVADLTMMMPATLPANTALVTTFDVSGRVIDHIGAVELAIYDSDTSLWCGSYHGGHSGSATFVFDDVVTDVSATGGIWLAKDIKIRQSGDIVSKLAVESLHQFRNASEFACTISASGAINATSFYTAMATTNIEWTVVNGVTYPVDGAKYPIGPVAWISQSNPLTPTKKLVTIQHDLVLNGTPQLPSGHVQGVIGSYAKPRVGIADGAAVPVAVNSLRYTMSHKLVRPAF